MTPTDRRTEIVNIVRRRQRVTVDELSRALHTSKETIRRDLTALERSGKIQKFHGGASLPMLTGEGPFSERMAEHAPAKVLIASQAARLISAGETLFIDTGSTTLYFAEALSAIPGLTIVTNSAEIARVTSRSGRQTRSFLIGGEFNPDNRQTIGSLATSQIRSFRAHHTVLTISAVDAKNGIMDCNIEEAQVARAMIEQAESLTILVDSSKFDKIASFQVCNLERVTNLVCERPPPAGLKRALQQAGVNILAPAQ